MSDAAFSKFLNHFSPDVQIVDSGPLGLPEWAIGRVRHWSELMGQFAGCSFENGVYRLHSSASADQANRMVSEQVASRRLALPGDFFCFGLDWLGRQFALENLRQSSGEPAVCLIDPITHETFEIPANFSEFHNEVLVQQADAALDATVFRSWVSVNPDKVPLEAHQIVGYRIPLSLGGKHEVENFTLIDLEIELEFNRQIDEQIQKIQQ